MKFNKIGKIFDPRDHNLSNNCYEYAQSPQAIVFDDFVRIFFSSREKDKLGKYISHVFYVDFDKAFRNILRVAEKPVIRLGELGCFDEHGIFPLSPFKEDDRILAFTTGWNRKVSTSADAAIGLAESRDGGRTFEKFGNGPIVAANLHEPFLVGDAFVSKYLGVYYMWYIYGLRWITNKTEPQPQRVYKISQATSVNLVDWKRDGTLLIPDVLGNDECQALPTVLESGGLFHMVFCYRHAFGFRNDKTKSYRIGYAYSSDLTQWHRDDVALGMDVSQNGWDSEMICYPHIFKCDEKIYLLYNGNEFGKHGFGLAVLDPK
jgi:hypothetical protein